jgi:cholesterol transport system auxiliary component
MMRKIFFYALAALAFTGCSLQTKVAANTQYRLDIPVEKKEFSALTCKDNLLQLKNIGSNDVILGRSIYYKVGDYKFYSYAQSNWEEAPSKTIQEALLQHFREIHIFKEIITNRSSAKPEYILEYSVEDFIQHFSEDTNSSYADVKIHYAIIENKSSKLLYSTTIQKRVDADSQDAFGGVKALRVALRDVIAQSSAWLDERCQKGLK